MKLSVCPHEVLDISFTLHILRTSTDIGLILELSSLSSTLSLGKSVFKRRGSLNSSNNAHSHALSKNLSLRHSSFHSLYRSKTIFSQTHKHSYHTFKETLMQDLCFLFSIILGNRFFIRQCILDLDGGQGLS